MSFNFRQGNHKFGAKKTVVDGITFSSKKEANFYQLLKIKERAGEVIKIDLQPVFLLQPAFKKKGKSYRKIEYVADFLVTYSDGRVEIIDCKGFKTDVYKIKQKMFEYVFPDLTIRET